MNREGITKEQELEVRISMCKFCIETLEKIDDPRQPEALQYYKDQLSELESKLPKPPDIVIGLKPATLSAIIPQMGE